ncbi:hypothetical protein M0804_000777 [Polistes exclamans]|nr:hypothetical protein M0804_000777 [Polistes exclamans]
MGEECVKEVQIGDNKITVLIDTGSSLSLITMEQYFKICAPKLGKKVLQFRGVGSDLNNTYGEIETTVTIDGKEYPIKLHVVSGTLVRHDLLTGNDFLRNVNVAIDAGKVFIRDTGNIKDDMLVVLPRALQAQIVRRAHEQGHFAVDKIVMLVKKDYWCVGMGNVEEKVMRNRYKCILAEKKNGRLKGWLYLIERGKECRKMQKKPS